MRNRAQFKPGDITLGQSHEFMVAFGKQGGTRQRLENAKDNQEIMAGLVEFLKTGGYKPHEYVQRICRYMYPNVLSVEDVSECFEITPSKSQIEAMDVIRYSEATLKKHKETHVLVADFGLSILNISGRINKRLIYRDDVHPYDKEDFSKVGNRKIGWRLVRKTSIPNSKSKSLEQKKNLLTEHEEIPSVALITFITIGMFLRHGIRIFEHEHVLCRETNSAGRHISAGMFSKNLSLNNGGWDDLEKNWDHVGLASMEKWDF